MSLHSVAERVAKKYASRVGWRGIELSDLEQVAHLACVEAKGTFNSEHGAPLDAYAYRAAMNAVWKYVWRDAPVSAPDHSLRELRGKHRVDIEALALMRDANPWPDQVLALQRWRADVRDQLEALVQNEVAHDRMTVNEAVASLSVALGQGAPRDIADANALTIAQVYKARRRLSLLVLHDLRCYRLWKEPQ